MCVHMCVCMFVREVCVLSVSISVSVCGCMCVVSIFICLCGLYGGVLRICNIIKHIRSITYTSLPNA